MKLALDVDGVLADFQGYVCEVAGIDPNRLKTWHFEDSIGAPLAKKMYTLMGRAETWQNLPVFDGARNAVARLVAACVDFEFVTAVPPRFAYEREQWIAEHFGPVAPVTIVQTKSKVDHMLWAGFTHIVDDNPATIYDAAEAGLKAILVPSRYSDERPMHPTSRLMTLTDFVKEITADVPV